MKIKFGLSSSIRPGKVGNSGSGVAAADTTAPTVTITCAQISPTGISPLNFTFTFSEAVTGFVVGDITVGNGTAGNFADTGDHIVYTADVTPSASGAVTVDVAGGVCTDGAGNGNTAATQFSITYQPLLNSLVGFWKMGETTGNRVNSVSSSFPFVPQNTVGYTTGKIGNCATMATGASNYLLVASDAALTAIDWTGGVTVVGWFQAPGAIVNNSKIFGKTNGAVGDFFINLGNSTVVQATTIDSVSGTSQVNKSLTINVDTWYFFSYRYNPSTKKTEANVNNGTWAVASSALSNGIKNGTSTLEINRNSAIYGNLYIDAVGCWNRYLSDAECTALYNGGTGIEYPF